jgi:serine/threonine protein kinase
MPQVSPALSLLGQELGQWKVVQSLHANPADTGGHFSHPYIVENQSKQRAFLKAMDLHQCFGPGIDTSAAISATTLAYQHERKLAEICKENRLSRIVKILDAGQLGDKPDNLVLFIIFELVDKNLRRALTSGELSLLYSLTLFHNVVVATQQVHRVNIAHQDIKPSNILVDAVRGGLLADFGRSSHREISVEHDKCACAGDLWYGPPELLHQHSPPNWDDRRTGCDIYLLGSLLFSMFQQTSLTTFMFHRIPSTLRPSFGSTSAVVYEDALPYWQNAFGEALFLLRQGLAGVPIADELVGWVSLLSNPDYKLRKVPHSRRGRFDLQGFVSKIDRARYVLTAAVNKN